MSALSLGKTAIVYDFDWTCVDTDTDTHILESLSAIHRAKLESLQGIMHWIDLMDTLFGDLHEAGFKKEDFERVLKLVPLRPEMIEALILAKAANCDIFILSDANTFSIETVLEHYGVRHLLTDIITNPASFDTAGRLRVKRFIPEGECHGCSLSTCTVNLCKGRELMNRWMAHYDRIIYIGDGANNLCPGLKLRSTDFFLPRIGRVLSQLLKADSKYPKPIANIIHWAEASDILAIFRNLLPLSINTKGILNVTRQSVSSSFESCEIAIAT